MKIYKVAENKPENWEEMKAWFNKRTNKHIERVAKYCNALAKKDNRFKDLIERAKIHDQSKFKDPEIEPYIYITWNYKCKDDGVNFKIPKDIKTEMSQATEHHVKHNKHHAEYHSKKEVDLINEEDRDKPPEEMIDATNMPDIDIAEMVCDWCAMSQERGGNPNDWAKKNVNVRWKFNKDQEELIYESIEKIWND